MCDDLRPVTLFRLDKGLRTRPSEWTEEGPPWSAPVTEFRALRCADYERLVRERDEALLAAKNAEARLAAAGPAPSPAEGAAPAPEGAALTPAEASVQPASDAVEAAPAPAMTLRDRFASHAPAMPSDLGRLALEEADVRNPDKTHGEKCDVLLAIVAEWRYRYADAMLAARAKGWA